MRALSLVLTGLIATSIAGPVHAGSGARRNPDHPRSAASAFIKQDRGGLDVRVGPGRLVLRSYLRTPTGWRMSKKILRGSATSSPDDHKALESFRQVRRLIVSTGHFTVPEDQLIGAALSGALARGGGTPTLADLYRGATDNMVKYLQTADRWARVETPAQHVARTTPATNNVTAHRLPGDVAMIKIRRFRGPVSAQLAEALAVMKQKAPLRGLVIDLRGNGGGLVNEAHQLLSQFLPDGQKLLTTELGPLGKPIKLEEMKAVAPPGGPDLKLPIAVIVDGKSASASELTTGVFKDLRRVRVFGDKTYGKGVGQRPRSLPDGRIFQQTEWRRRLSRLGTYHGEGIHPDESSAQAEARVQRAAGIGRVRDRGDRVLRGALLYLWDRSAPEAAKVGAGG